MSRFKDGVNNLCFSDPELIGNVKNFTIQILADVPTTLEDRTIAVKALKTLSSQVTTDEVESKTETGKFLEWVEEYIQVSNDDFSSVNIARRMPWPQRTCRPCSVTA